MPHPSSSPSVARRLARFVSGLRLEDVPPAVVARATLLALDTLGSALASSGQDFGRAVIQAAERLGGPPESGLIGHKHRVGAAAAVLANGTLAHGLDFDDTREDAIVHTGCVAVTTALGVGEAVEASGREVLAAMIASVEVMCRVGLAVPGRFHARHYHPTALTGSFAAAAAAGRLYRLTEDQQVSAFGICGSQASGIIEYLADGSWTKRLHPGWAAHSGVVAARLAALGYIGPRDAIAGRDGFLQAYSDTSDVHALTSGLPGGGGEAEPLAIFRTSIKAHACCRYMQAPIDAVIERAQFAE